MAFVFPKPTDALRLDLLPPFRRKSGVKQQSLSVKAHLLQGLVHSLCLIDFIEQYTQATAVLHQFCGLPGDLLRVLQDRAKGNRHNRMFFRSANLTHNSPSILRNGSDRRIVLREFFRHVR